MPNKVKSQKSLPNVNGALSTAHTESGVIESELNGGKKSTKSKSKTTNKRKSQPNENDCQAVQNDEITAVGEELLRRLQLNGTSISLCGNGIISSANESNAMTKDVNHVPNANNINNSNINKNHSRDKDDNVPNNVNNNSDSEVMATQCNGDQAIIDENGQILSKMSRISTDAANIATQSALTKIAGETILSNSQLTQNATESAQKSQHSTAATTSSTSSEPSQPSTSQTKPNPILSKEPIYVEYHELPPTTFALDGTPLPPIRTALSVKSINTSTIKVTFKEYENELQMPDIMRVIQRELSEPYSIYTYRYFIHNWPKLCFLAMDGENCIGAIVCKLDIHRQLTKRGYIAMLAVDAAYRKLKVGTTLVQKAIEVCGRFPLFL